MRRRPARRRAGLAAIAALLAATLASGPSAAQSQSTLEPSSESARSVADLWWFMLIVSTIVVAIVVALVLLAILRRRGEDDPGPSRLRRVLGGERAIAIGGVAIPLVILAVLFALVLGSLDETASGGGESDLRIEVTGRQWFWDVSYPEAGAKTANEIHIPAGEPVTVELESADVIHSFWVPELNRKIDLIPGRTNELTLEADEPGTFRGQCAEFCGIQHANMAFLVVAHERGELDAWLEHEAQPAPEPASESARAGERVFMGEGCASCHAIRGTEARGEVGPDLTHLASRETLAAATLDNDRGDLGGWVLDPQHIKPGVKMPATELSGPELQDLLDYLEGLE